MRGLRTVFATTIALGALAVSAGSAGAVPVSIPGNPLTVNIDSLGQCQSIYPGSGGNFFPGSDPTGDCGFFIAAPAGATQPPGVGGSVFGFDGHAGPHGLASYTPVSQGPVTGSGTAASPYTQVTVYDVNSTTPAAVLQITQTTTYVNGQASFISYFDVKNVSAAPIKYRAIYAGDLYVNGDDEGTGVFTAGPPRFVGGQNATSGVLGGFYESLQYVDGTATPAWTSYAEDYWGGFGAPGIWSDVQAAATAPQAFPNSVNPTLFDNGAGVAWDTNLTTGLAPGQDQHYSIVNFASIPSALVVNPTAQGLVQGQTATINVTSANSAGAPYANTSVRYSISGANPQTGVVTTNAAGTAQIRYVGNHPGVDLVSIFVDLGNTGTQVAADPAGTAQVTFVPQPPVPNSSVTIKNVKVNSDGSITITYVPNQDGQGTLTVTVPTAGVASVAKAKRCRKGKVKIKGKCRPKTTTVGSVSVAGHAGVPLTLTVKPSRAVKRKLKRGRKLHVTAILKYQSARGGAPSTSTYHVTLKGKKKR